MFPALAWAAFAGLLSLVPTHPHHPKVVQLQGARGALAVSYFTVHFNPEQLNDLAPGFDWHLGFAQVRTVVGLRCGDVEVPKGEWKLNVRRGGGAGDWSVVLVPRPLYMAEMGVLRASRRGEEAAVAEARAAVERVKAELGEAKSPLEIVLPVATVPSPGDTEHLTLTGMHHGYAAVQRGSFDPAGGMSCSLRIDFGDLHRELRLEEIWVE